MHFRILLGNHSWHTYEMLGDMVLHLKNSLEEINHFCEIETTGLSPQPVIIVLEHFQTSRIADQFIELAKAGGRFGIIFTETVTGDTLNHFQDSQANTFAQYDENSNKISEREYWKLRHDNFAKVAPYSSFVWCLVEKTVEDVKALAQHEHVYFLPFGYCPRFRNISHPPLKERDFDFSVFGRLTPHRVATVSALRERGMSVVQTPMMLPRYMRDDLLKRTRINLWMRMSPEWGMASTHRASHLLNNHAYQLNQTAAATYMDDYVMCAEPNLFPEVCAAAVRDPAFYQRQDALIAHYQADLPMAPIMERLVAQSLGGAEV